MVEAPALFVGPPLDGEWAALNSPGSRIPSHGTDFFGQRYAFDFVRRTPGSRLILFTKSVRQGLLPVHPVSWYGAWNEVVRSVAHGTVEQVGEGWRDPRIVAPVLNLLLMQRRTPFSESDFRPLAGNFVIVRCERACALYAHLRCGSVVVAPGERVAEGQPLGRVGHSGRSTMPHLHFQLMSGPDPFSAAGVFCGFRLYEVLDGRQWRKVEDGVPRSLERLRFAPAEPSPQT